ncbi:uncharacterized protein METZ01_LOCUS455681, partial [marine metagenome]
RVQPAGLLAVSVLLVAPASGGSHHRYLVERAAYRHVCIRRLGGEESDTSHRRHQRLSTGATVLHRTHRRLLSRRRCVVCHRRDLVFRQRSCNPARL